HFLASYRHLAREKGYSPLPPLIVTTNYDDALERALGEQDEDFDVIAYVANRDGQSTSQRFIHIPPGGEPILLERPRGYLEADPDRRTVILKIHGTLVGGDRDLTSFVIAEEEYVDYLTVNTWDAIPAPLVARLSRSHLLFLGYSMRDWNLLVVLRRLGVLNPPDRHTYAGRKSWAFQLNPTDVDAHRWKRYDTT